MGLFLFDKKVITVHEFGCPFVLDIINHPENIKNYRMGPKITELTKSEQKTILHQIRLW